MYCWVTKNVHPPVFLKLEMNTFEMKGDDLHVAQTYGPRNAWSAWAYGWAGIYVSMTLFYVANEDINLRYERI